MSWICISIENPLRSLFIHLYDMLKLYYVIFIGSIDILKWGASSRWLTSLYYPMRNSDELTIIINVIIIWYNKLIWYKYNDIIYITFWYKIKISPYAQNWPQLSFSIFFCLVLRGPCLSNLFVSKLTYLKIVSIQTCDPSFVSLLSGYWV